jgi:hypothetical protein
VACFRPVRLTRTATARWRGRISGKLEPGCPYVWTDDGRVRELDVPAGWEGGAALANGSPEEREPKPGICKCQV